MRVNGLSINKRKKSVGDLDNERSIEFFGVTLVERSDENLKWMREHGYIVKKKARAWTSSKNITARAREF